MDIERFRIGSIEGMRFVHGRGRGTPEWMFPDVPAPALVDRMAPCLDADGTFSYVFSSALVDVGGRLVLLDASLPGGNGATSSIERFLAAAEIEADEIDTVIVTHGHLDHVGGLVRAGAPAFRRARHVIHRDEFESQHDGGALRLLAEAGSVEVVDVVDGDQDVLNGVVVIPTPGHTPGHLAVSITSDGDTGFYVGDVLAHEVNIAEPGWNHFSDGVGELAARSRRALVERARTEGALVVGSHLTTIGRVATSATGAPLFVGDPNGHSSVM